MKSAATKLAARFIRGYRRRFSRARVLFIEDHVPHIKLGAGFPRSNRILSEMARMGLSVTVYPAHASYESWASAYKDIPLKVEVILGRGLPDLEQFLIERGGRYELFFVSRPHNMAFINSLARDKPGLLKGTKIIYDAEAIFCLREIERLRQQGEALPPDRERSLIREEVKTGETSHCVVSVSERESRIFAEHGIERVHTLGHALKQSPTPSPFDSRKDILFVGAIHGSSPNMDSVIWFSREILPLVRERSGQDVRLIIAGANTGTLAEGLAGGPIEIAGEVDDLTPLYDRARLFVAPTRFAAGIPLKIYEAAAHGLPVVATSLLAAQLGWHDGCELLATSDAKSFAAACLDLYLDRELWNRLRSNALNRVRADCSPEIFSAKLRQIIEETLGAG